MANQEHLRILKEGTEVWNKFVLENAVPDNALLPGEPVGYRRGALMLPDADLSDANLRITDLRRANLRRANLQRADLSHARLGDANLAHADLRGANLTGAEPISADLGYADLSDANLTEADLSKAILIGANLCRALLDRATLESADLWEADLNDASLSKADLNHAQLVLANLNGANLSGARLSGASLNCTLIGANLSDAYLASAVLDKANLSDANLTNANLYNASLKLANLTGADLTGADLTLAHLVETNFTNATITGCHIYGTSAWNLTLVGAAQYDLVISKKGEPIVTVDNLEVGQFIYLMLNNTKIRDVINAITSKGVLILGRFSDPQRKSVLDGLREKLREYDLLPMVFDFDCPTDKDYTETIQTLAGMSMFVIADLTNPKSTPLELEATVKQFKIPYIPIIDISVDPRPFAMLVDSQKSFHWVLTTLGYESKEELLDDKNLKTYIIDRANAKREELREAKNQEPEMILIRKKEVTASS